MAGRDTVRRDHCFIALVKFADHVLGFDLLLLGTVVSFVSAMDIANGKQSEMKEAAARLLVRFPIVKGLPVFTPAQPSQ